MKKAARCSPVRLCVVRCGAYLRFLNCPLALRAGVRFFLALAMMPPSDNVVLLDMLRHARMRRARILDGHFSQNNRPRQIGLDCGIHASCPGQRHKHLQKEIRRHINPAAALDAPDARP